MRNFIFILGVIAVLTSCTTNTNPTTNTTSDSTKVDTVKADTTIVVVLDSLKK